MILPPGGWSPFSLSPSQYYQTSPAEGLGWLSLKWKHREGQRSWTWSCRGVGVAGEPAAFPEKSPGTRGHLWEDQPSPRVLADSCGSHLLSWTSQSPSTSCSHVPIFPSSCCRRTRVDKLRMCLPSLLCRQVGEGTQTVCVCGTKRATSFSAQGNP